MLSIIDFTIFKYQTSETQAFQYYLGKLVSPPPFLNSLGCAKFKGTVQSFQARVVVPI